MLTEPIWTLVYSDKWQIWSTTKMASWTPILKHCDFLLSWNGTTFWRVELHHWTCLRDCPREEQCLKQANLSCTFGGGIITTTTTEVRDRQAFSWNRDAFMNQLKTQVIQPKGQKIFSLWWVAFVQFFYLFEWLNISRICCSYWVNNKISKSNSNHHLPHHQHNPHNYDHNPAVDIVMTLLLDIVIVLTYDWMRALGQCRFGLVGWLDTGRFFAQQHFKLTLTGQGVGGVHTIMMDDEDGDDGNDAYMHMLMVVMLRGLLWVANLLEI